MTRSFRGILMLIGLLAFTVLTLWFASPGFTADDTHVVTPVEEVTFQPGPPTLPEGAQIAVLSGNPAEEGAFVVRLKFPAGYEVPAHTHSKQEQLTVLSGRFGMSTGETLDKTGVTPLAPGGFVRIPAGHPHFAWAEEETVVQLHGMGPFDVTYVNEADDPRIN